MSYLKAEDILPKELIETIQQYVNGQTIYIPSVEKQEWGSNTDTKQFLKDRNMQIYNQYQEGKATSKLAVDFSLSVKSIQRINLTIYERTKPKKIPMDLYELFLCNDEIL